MIYVKYIDLKKGNILIIHWIPDLLICKTHNFSCIVENQDFCLFLNPEVFVCSKILTQISQYFNEQISLENIYFLFNIRKIEAYYTFDCHLVSLRQSSNVEVT